MIDFYEIDDLIAKVLTNEATEKERDALRLQLAESPEMQQYFEQMQRLWVASEAATDAIDVNTDAAWTKVKTRIYEPHKQLKINWLQPKYSLRIAASIAVLAVATFAIFQKKRPLSINDVPTIVEAKDTVLAKTLADNSMITLNKKSTLTTNFNDKERRVKLEGEAYFEIAHDTVKPFFIEVKNLEIRVVGTAFNVDDRSEFGKVIITVVEGKVLLKGIKSSVFLTKGEKVEYVIATGDFEKAENRSLNFMAYKTRELVYQGETFSKVVEDINGYYGVSVEIMSPEIKNCPISALVNFGKQPLSEILAGFEAQIPTLTIERDKNERILLRGTKCGE